MKPLETMSSLLLSLPIKEPDVLQPDPPPELKTLFLSSSIF